MRYAYKYRLSPTPTVERELQRHIDVCRQAYNHFLHELREADGYLSQYEMQSMLPEMKEWWDDLSECTPRFSRWSPSAFPITSRASSS